MKKLILKWLGAVSQEDFEYVIECLGYLEDDLISKLQKQNEVLHEQVIGLKNMLYLHITPTDPPSPAIFDPKSEPYPDELGGMKLGFATVTEECCLWAADKDNVLYPYKDDSWGDNTNAKRIMVNPTRKAVAVNRMGDIWWISADFRPFQFDGGILAYEVCPLQTIDGKDLFAGLYLLVSDVKDAWL